MAVDKTTHSFATKLRTAAWSAATPETVPADGSFSDFGQATEYDVPKSASTDVKATRLNQTDRYHRFKKGFIDAGELVVRGHFDKTDYNTLLTDDAAGTEKWYQVQIPEPDSTTNVSKFSFHGYVKGLGIAVPDDEGISCEFTIKVNGKPQFTPFA